MTEPGSIEDANRDVAEGAQAEADPWLGKVLDDRYRVLERLAEGGMGVVYVAEHLALHKEVALKLVHEDQSSNKDHARRFVREAMVTSRIDHPNVISALDFGSFEDGTAYLAMNLVRGPTLSDVLETEGVLTWARAAEIGAQIADALSAAQGHGIVHRDLKPDNVILQQLDDGSELVKVLDFGIAKYARDSMAPPPLHATHAVTRMGVVIGTPGYMSPEQAVGKRADHRSDLYSLGVLLWECVVGHRLWDFNDVQKLLAAQLNQAPPSVRVASADLSIPEEFDAIVAALLATQTKDRPENAVEVRDRLRELVAAVKRGSLVSPPPPPPRARSSPRPEPKTEPIAPARIATPTRVERPNKRPKAPGEAALDGAPATSRPPAVKAVLDASNPPPAAVRRALRGSSPGARAWPRALALGGALCALGIAAWAARSPPLRPVHHAAQRARAAGAALPLAEDVRPLLHDLVEAGTREERVAAAQALLRHVPVDEVPSYARTMARLQLAETCQDKKELLASFRTLDDPRTLPVLVALSQRKRGGCGPRGRYDCLACLRDDLATLLKQLEGKQVSRAPIVR